MADVSWWHNLTAFVQVAIAFDFGLILFSGDNSSLQKSGSASNATSTNNQPSEVAKNKHLIELIRERLISYAYAQNGIADADIGRWAHELQTKAAKLPDSDEGRAAKAKTNDLYAEAVNRRSMRNKPQQAPMCYPALGLIGGLFAVVLLLILSFVDIDKLQWINAITLSSLATMVIARKVLSSEKYRDVLPYDKYATQVTLNSVKLLFALSGLCLFVAAYDAYCGVSPIISFLVVALTLAFTLFIAIWYLKESKLCWIIRWIIVTAFTVPIYFLLYFIQYINCIGDGIINVVIAILIPYLPIIICIVDAYRDYCGEKTFAESIKHKSDQIKDEIDTVMKTVAIE